jgi:EF-P beta-lysylation protein EpmB
MPSVASPETPAPMLLANAADGDARGPIERGFVKRPAELLALLDLDPALPALDFARLRDFPLRVPRGFVARMRRRDPLDPLFLQVWPRVEEGYSAPGYLRDPVGDLTALKPGGLIHKYAGRALVIATSACAVHCRYCFRRHFPYSEALGWRGSWDGLLTQIGRDPEIHEVILSGGDPLSLADDKLADLVRQLSGLPQVTRLRIHSRTPVVSPERINEALIDWMRPARLQTVMVIHANHPNEIDDSVAAAMTRLHGAGIRLLNQSVLLRGINDDAATLAALSERLFACHVFPYYLHALDLVEGAAHFAVGTQTAIEIMRSLNRLLPGYLMPRLVREIAGAPGKVAIAW